ncbi:hypothetical protein BH11PLA1_BH11PLA1_02920 [soil metagenome]
MNFDDLTSAALPSSESIPASDDRNPSPEKRDENAGAIAAFHAGDREALAKFLDQNSRLLLSRIRAKMPTRTRRLVDAEDILSTISRRLVGVIKRGELKARTTPQLWALLTTMIERTVIDADRRSTRLCKAERGLAGEIRGHGAQAAPAGEGSDASRVDMRNLFQQLKSDNDRFVLQMWLKDVPWAVAADHLNITPECMRKRWQQVRGQLRKHLEDAGGFGLAMLSFGTAVSMCAAASDFLDLAAAA